MDDLAWLAARARITDLIYGYARNIRGGDPAANEPLFASEAVFEMRDAPATDIAGYTVKTRLEGWPAIQDYIVASGAAGGTVWPTIHNLLIDIDGDTATSTCVMTAHLPATAKTLLGQYDDSFRCDGGAWRFANRTYTLLRHA